MGIKVGTPCVKSEIKYVTKYHEDGVYSVDKGTFVEIEQTQEYKARVRDCNGLSMTIPYDYLSQCVITEMPTEKTIKRNKFWFNCRIVLKVMLYIFLVAFPFITALIVWTKTSTPISNKITETLVCLLAYGGILTSLQGIISNIENYTPYYTTDNLKELAVLLDYKEPKLQNPTADFIGLAEVIAKVLENREFDDVTSNSGYFLLKQLNDNCGLYVDVYKSTSDGEEEPHYVIYCSDDNENTDYHYTKDLTVISLAKEFEDIANCWE